MAATLLTGQVVIAVTGTPVALSAAANVSADRNTMLQNGVVVSAKSTNNASQGTIGGNNVTNATNGTGNGLILAAGGSMGIGAGANLALIYVNGTAGDVFSFVGN